MVPRAAGKREALDVFLSSISLSTAIQTGEKLFISVFLSMGRKRSENRGEASFTCSLADLHDAPVPPLLQQRYPLRKFSSTVRSSRQTGICTSCKVST